MHAYLLISTWESEGDPTGNTTMRKGKKQAIGKGLHLGAAMFFQ